MSLPRSDLTSNSSGEFSSRDWLNLPCGWCGSEDSELLFQGPDRLERLPGQFQMVRCSSCGLIRQNPRLVWEKLKEYYPEDYAAYQYDSQQAASSLKKSIQSYGNIKRRRALEAYVKGGRLLEVGCGTGAFLRILQATHSWEVVGIEPSPPAAAYARQTLEASIYEGRFSEISLPEESFDAVVMFCVLEHLEDPIGDIHRVYEVLKPGGWFVFTIPNHESLGRHIFGRYWAGWDLPRHLHIFPHETLQRILEETRFQIASRKCLATSYHALGHSLEFWTQSWETRYPSFKQFLVRMYYSWVMRISLFVPLAILDSFKGCTNITYFVQKPEVPKGPLD